MVGIIIYFIGVIICFKLITYCVRRFIRVEFKWEEVGLAALMSLSSIVGVIIILLVIIYNKSGLREFFKKEPPKWL